LPKAVSQVIHFAGNSPDAWASLIISAANLGFFLKTVPSGILHFCHRA